MNNDEELKNLAMMIIASAGECKGLAYEAIKKAKTGDFVQAEELMEKAKKSQAEAHNAHFQLLIKESNGELEKINVLITHAQDHFMASLTAMDMATEMIELYSMVDRLEKRIEKGGQP